MVKMRGLLHGPFAFKIFSQLVPTRPGTQTFWQVPDPSRPEVKNPYPSDPARETRLLPTWTVKPILNHITNHIDYRWARSGLFPLNLLCNPGASALGAPHR